MPRENVNSDLADIPTRVEVSWQAGAYMQLTTAQREDAAGDDDTGPRPYVTGAHVSLDRDGVNRLIRVLRRARDAVFGKDA